MRLGNFIAILASLVAFIAAGSRPDNFPDVDTYEIIYDLSARGDFSDPDYWLFHGEPLFKILAYVLNYLGSNFKVFLLFMAFLSYYLLFIISKLSKIPFSYLWFAYFSFFFITRDLGVIRLSIASHLIVIMLLKRKLIHQILIVSFSSFSFQYFSFLSLAAPLLSRFKLNTFRLSLLIVISLALSSLLSFEVIASLMPEKQTISYSGVEMAEPTLIPIVRNFLFAGFIFFLFEKQLHNSKLNTWVWAAFLSVILYILTFNILIVSQRIGAYFGAIIPIALAYKMKRSQSPSELEFVSIAAICLLNFITVFYYNDFVWRYDLK